MFPQTAEVQHAVDVLCEHQMASVITEWFLQTLQHKMSSELNPKFWKHFSGPVEDVVSQLSAAFDELLSEVCGDLTVHYEPKCLVLVQI